MQITPTVNGLHVIYSYVNQSYYLMWHGIVLEIHNSKDDALHAYHSLLKG
jgi:hypothetical protein